MWPQITLRLPLCLTLLWVMQVTFCSTSALAASPIMITGITWLFQFRGLFTDWGTASKNNRVKMAPAHKIFPPAGSILSELMQCTPGQSWWSENANSSERALGEIEKLMVWLTSYDSGYWIQFWGTEFARLSFQNSLGYWLFKIQDNIHIISWWYACINLCTVEQWAGLSPNSSGWG